MSPLTVRRITVWIVSMVMGVFLTLAILTFFLPENNPSPSAKPIGIGVYGIQYFLSTAFPLGMVFVTILDYFMEAKIWPD